MEKKFVLKKEKWICSDGEWGGWYTYQCNHCWRYISTWLLETRKGLVDKRIKKCPYCRVSVKIDNKVEW